MANRFSTSSLKRLREVHPALQELCIALLHYQDITITYGVRTVEEQRILVGQGLSKTMYSKHLRQSDGYSHAVDIAPYPIDWNDTKRFYYMAGMMKVLAPKYLKDDWYLRWGGNWDMDEDLNDQSFMDLGHWELIKR